MKRQTGRRRGWLAASATRTPRYHHSQPLCPIYIALPDFADISVSDAEAEISPPLKSRGLRRRDRLKAAVDKSTHHTFDYSRRFDQRSFSVASSVCAEAEFIDLVHDGVSRRSCFIISRSSPPTRRRDGRCDISYFAHRRKIHGTSRRLQL